MIPGGRRDANVQKHLIVLAISRVSRLTLCRTGEVRAQGYRPVVRKVPAKVGDDLYFIGGLGSNASHHAAMIAPEFRDHLEIRLTTMNADHEVTFTLPLMHDRHKQDDRYTEPTVGHSEPPDPLERSGKVQEKHALLYGCPNLCREMAMMWPASTGQPAGSCGTSMSRQWPMTPKLETAFSGVSRLVGRAGLEPATNGLKEATSVGAIC